jgi:RNA polymerase sigma-70 factor, ECF subfamily
MNNQPDFNNRVSDQFNPLRNFALRLTRNLEDAVDLTQETMLKAFVNKTKFKDGTNLKAWLHTIMKNIFINNYRRKVNGQIVHDDTENQYHLNSYPHYSGNQGERQIVLDDVNQAINGLSDNLKVPFMMAFEGHKYEEIANHLSVPLGTVKIRIHNARKKLKKKLDDYNPKQ